MSIKTLSKRPAELSRFESLQVYLEERGFRDHRSLCHVIAEVHRGWITPVLGSGCAQSNATQQLSRVVNSVVNQLAKDPRGDHQNKGYWEIAEEFAMHLITDRLQETFRRDESAEPATVPEWLAELVLVAAFANRLYSEAKAQAYHALPRRRCQDQVRLLVPSSSDLRPQVVDTGEALLPTLKAPGGDNHDVRQAAAVLLEKVLAGLRDESAHLAAEDALGLSEIAWFCLAYFSDQHLYLGWSDLMLLLSNLDNPPGGGGVGRPLFDQLAGAEEHIAERYRQATRQSWDKREISDVFNAVARLLVSQEACRVGADRDRPPVATGFVTSFDLMLELALLDRGASFLVAMPVYVQIGRSAHPVWLGLEVLPEGGKVQNHLKGLLSPPIERWRVLNRKDELSGPVVVRLAGCPIIRLPELSDGADLATDLWRVFYPECLNLAREKAAKRATEAGKLADQAMEEEELERVQRGLKLKHAIIVNEHDALLHASLDALSMNEGALTGLPQSLVTDPKATNPWTRFWLMLGVQVQDTAVRQRLVSLVANGSLGSARGRAARSYGVAVNLRATLFEQDLLSWNGVDLVRADVADLTAQINGCAVHLERNEPMKSDSPCEICR